MEVFKMTEVECYLLRQKYVDTIIDFSKVTNLSLNKAFHRFYQSKLYQRIICSTVQEVLSIPEEDLVDELVREYSMD